MEEEDAPFIPNLSNLSDILQCDQPDLGISGTSELLSVVTQLVMTEDEETFLKLQSTMRQQLIQVAKEKGVQEDVIDSNINAAMSCVESFISFETASIKLVKTLVKYFNSIGNKEFSEEEMWDAIQVEIHQNTERYLKYFLPLDSSEGKQPTYEPATYVVYQGSSLSDNNTKESGKDASKDETGDPKQIQNVSMENNGISKEKGEDKERKENSFTQINHYQLPTKEESQSSKEVNDQPTSFQIENTGQNVPNDPDDPQPSDDIIIKIVMKSICNVIKLPMCLFDSTQEINDWSYVFLPDSCSFASKATVIVVFAMTRNLFTVSHKREDIMKFLPFHEIKTNPFKHFGEPESLPEAFQQLRDSFTYYRKRSLFIRTFSEMIAKKQSEIYGRNIVLTGSIKEMSSATDSDSDFMVQINNNSLCTDNFEFLHNSKMIAYVISVLHGETTYQTFVQQHPELEAFLTKSTKRKDDWYINGERIKTFFKEDSQIKNIAQSLLHCLPDDLCITPELSNSTSPALTFINKFRELDMVIALKFTSWPQCFDEWIKRVKKVNFPTAETVDKILNSDFYIVPKPSSVETIGKEWRMSFSVPESILIDSFDEDQSFVYYVMRSIHSYFFKEYKFNKMITSYHIKTVMFWVCELIPIDWTNHNLALGFLFEFLVHCCLNKSLPHYFMSVHNLFHDMNEDECRSFQISLNVIRKHLEKIIKSFIITSNEIGLMPRVEMTWVNDYLIEFSMGIGKLSKEEILLKHIGIFSQEVQEYIGRESISPKVSVIIPLVQFYAGGNSLQKRNLSSSELPSAMLMSNVCLFTCRLLEVYCRNKTFLSQVGLFDVMLHLHVQETRKGSKNDEREIKEKMKDALFAPALYVFKYLYENKLDYTCDTLISVVKSTNTIIKKLEYCQTIQKQPKELGWIYVVAYLVNKLMNEH